MYPYRNYDHVSSLWEFEGWINQTTVDLAKAHYAAYMVKRVDGLRIITLNTDLCELDPPILSGATGQGSDLSCLCPPLNRVPVRSLCCAAVVIIEFKISSSPPNVHSANWFAYINQSHIDPNGMMRFLTDELQEAEDAGDRG